MLFGVQNEIHICEECAQQRGIQVHGDKLELSFGHIINEIRNAVNMVQQKLDSRACPVCATSLYQLKKNRSVGCPECYHFFHDDIKQLMDQSGILGAYSGDLPQRLAQSRSSLTDRVEIQGKLEESIAREDYERAAMYRDQLRGLAIHDNAPELSGGVR
jgi:protein arginine kinase activator